MNEETNNKSELEAFFQNRLNDDTPSNDGWDNPPSYVLDNAFAEIDEKKRKRFGFIWYWIFGGASLVVLVGLLVWSTNRINEIDDKLTALIEIQDKTEPDHTARAVEDQREEESTFKEEPKPAEELPQKKYTSTSKKNVSNVKAFNSNNNWKQSAKITEATQQQSVEETVQKVFNDDPSLERVVTVYEEGKGASSLSNHQTTIDKPDLKEVDSSLTNLPFTKAQIVLSSNEIEDDSKFRNKVYLLLGGNASSLSMSALVPLPNNLTKYDNWYSGYQVGLGFTRKLKPKPWSLDFNVMYQLYRNSSVFKDESNYTKSNEAINTSGETVYNTTVGLESPISRYENRLSINLNNRTYAEGSPLKNSTDITNSFHVTAAQLGVGYSVYSNSHWDIQARVGIAANHVVEMKQQMEFEMQSDNVVLTSVTLEESSTKDMSTMYTSASLGLSVNRSFGDRMVLGVSSAYTKSLQSIRNVEGPNQVKTQLSLVQTSFVVGFKI